MQPFNLEQALAGKPFTNDKGWTVEDWHYFKRIDYPIAIKWKEHSSIWFYTGPELFMLPEKKKVWIVVYLDPIDNSIHTLACYTEEAKEQSIKYQGKYYLETIEKEYEL